MSVYSCDCGEYTFYMAHGTYITQVYPLNFLESMLEDSVFENHIFYRRKFNGSLIFGGRKLKADFTYFYDIEQSAPCDYLSFIIYKDSDIYWEGYFTTADGEFDLDKCTYTINPLSYDDYSDLLDLAGIQYNILTSTGIQTPVTTHAVWGTINIDYTHCRWLTKIDEAQNVLEFLADKVVAGVAVQADFFTDAINYVTLNTSHVRYLLISQKYDIINPTATYPAQQLMMSWNDLMEILWGMFQVTWEFDPTVGANGTIYVEHISYFTKANGMDTRGHKIAAGSNRYKYLKTEMPKYEYFSMMEAEHIDFKGYPIHYEDMCVDQDPLTNIREIAIPVSTDLEYIIQSPERISDSGVVVLCNYQSGGLNYVDRQIGIHLPDIRLNMQLSWSYLHESYFRHNRVLISGTLNEIPHTFVTAKKIKEQEIKAIACVDFDPSETITTELGETYFGGEKGDVAKASIKPSGEMDLILRYGPVDGVNSGWSDCFAVVGTVEYTLNSGHYTDITTHFEFSKPSAGINISIVVTVYDNLGALQCTSVSHSITFTAGARTIDDVWDFNCEIFVGWCAVVTISYNPAEICSIDIEPDAERSCANGIIYVETPTP